MRPFSILKLTFNPYERPPLKTSTDLSRRVLSAQYAKEELDEYLIPLTKALVKPQNGGERTIARKREERESTAEDGPPPPSPPPPPSTERLMSFLLPSVRILKEHGELNYHSILYGGDTKRLFQLIKKDGIRLEKGSSRGEYVSSTSSAESIPTCKFVSHLSENVRAISSLTNPLLLEPYGDFCYVLNLIAVWKSKSISSVDDSSYNDVVENLLPDALEDYLKLHFDQTENKHVTFHPGEIKDDGNPVNSLTRYAPPQLITKDLDVSYPRKFFAKTWPVEFILSSLNGNEGETKRGAAYMHLLLYSQIQRYVLVGLAILSTVYSVLGGESFRTEIIPYLLKLKPLYETLTTSEIFPGLYTAFILSRPTFNEESLIGIHLQRDLMYREPRLLGPFLKFFRSSLDVRSKLKATHKDILFQNVEIFLNELYKSATSKENVRNLLFKNAYDYDFTFKQLKAEQTVDYLIRGFTFKHQVDSVNPQTTGILQSIGRLKHADLYQI